MSPKVVSIHHKQTHHAMLSDEGLAAAAATGDLAALATFFERFHPLVARFISRLIGAREDIVEDLVQTTFLQIVEGKARFDGRSKATTWLLGIATNVVRRHWRTLGKQSRLVSAVAQNPALEPSHSEQAMHARSALRLVEAVLREQPEGHQLAFVLCEVEGLSATQAAEILDISVTAVWKRVSDTRRKIKKALEETT